jgi:hypothetical protein
LAITANDKANPSNAPALSAATFPRVAPSPGSIFGERQDEQGDGDSNHAVAEGDDPVEACVSFACHVAPFH